jgi:hypothetical protein
MKLKLDSYQIVGHLLALSSVFLVLMAQQQSEDNNEFFRWIFHRELSKNDASLHLVIYTIWSGLPIVTNMLIYFILREYSKQTRPYYNVECINTFSMLSILVIMLHPHNWVEISFSARFHIFLMAVSLSIRLLYYQTSSLNLSMALSLIIYTLHTLPLVIIIFFCPLYNLPLVLAYFLMLSWLDDQRQYDVNSAENRIFNGWTTLLSIIVMCSIKLYSSSVQCTVQILPKEFIVIMVESIGIVFKKMLLIGWPMPL